MGLGMNTPGSENILHGKWNQLKGKVKEQWGRLTDDDVALINGKQDQLAGRLEERYGWDKKRVTDEINRFLELHREH